MFHSRTAWLRQGGGRLATVPLGWARGVPGRPRTLRRGLAALVASGFAAGLLASVSPAVASAARAPRPVLGPVCPDVMVIAARGSGEQPQPGGPHGDWTQPAAYTYADTNYGVGKFNLAVYNGLVTALGPRLHISLDSVMYPADPALEAATGYAAYEASATSGAQAIVDDLAYFQRTCGTATHFVLAGYSQGAWAVHKALYAIDRATRRMISAVVLFGDPEFEPAQMINRGIQKGLTNSGLATLIDAGHADVPASLRTNTASYCLPHDPICQGVDPVAGLGPGIAYLANCWAVNWAEGKCPHTSYETSGATAQAVKFVRPRLPTKSAWPILRLSTPPTGTVGTAYSWRARATSTRPTTYTWSTQMTYYLPPGLSLASTGVVAGTPTRSGTYTFDIAATDGAGRTTDGSVTIVVHPGSGPAPPTCVGTCTVWGWGYGVNGTTTDTPMQVSGLTAVTAVAGGLDAGYAVKSDGTVWAWGYNTFGQLGNGTTTDSSTPVQVSGLTGVTAVAGGNAGYALRSDGTVWAWGFNMNGELGNGTTTESSTPVQVSGLTGVTAIAGGGGGGYALKSDGTVWAWGDGALTKSYTPVQVSGLTGVIAIAGGAANGYALKSDGTVWAWGFAEYGALGNGTTTESSTPVQVSGLTGVTAIAGGNFGGYAVKSDGTVWAWGLGQYGALGNGTTTDSSTPVQVSGLTGVTAVAGGYGDGYALKSDRTVWAWGPNTVGGLGNGTTTDSSTPVQVSGLTGVAAISSGSAAAFALVSAP